MPVLSDFTESSADYSWGISDGSDADDSDGEDSSYSGYDNSGSDGGTVTADTSALESALETASDELAELQSDLASEKAVAEADSTSLTKEEKEKEIKKNQRRSNYFGLKNKAEKLGKGEMTLEDYVKCSKTSIDDLIIFAKKENMEADVIRGLYKYVKPYKSYKTPFAKTDYLKSTILIINGQEVKPTEEDVDKCVEYLKASGSLICDKTVRNTVRGYLKGEIDITIKEEDLEEQTAENKEIISENEQKISDELVRVLVEQQDKVKSQKVEIANLKKKGIGTYGE